MCLHKRAFKLVTLAVNYMMKEVETGPNVEELILKAELISHRAEHRIHKAVFMVDWDSHR